MGGMGGMQGGMGQPGMGQPGMGQPGMGQPGMGQPGMGQPGMGQPGMGGMGYNPMQVPMQQYTPQPQFQYQQPYNRQAPYAIPPGTPPEAAGRMLEASNVFRTFDHDMSGTLKKKEFRNVMAGLGYPLAEQQAEQLFHTVDRDQSGKLDEREFVDWWLYYKPQLPAPQPMRIPFPPQYARPAYNYPGAMAPGQPFMTPMGIDPQTTELLQQASRMFRVYDADMSGKLKKKEFRFALRGFGYYIAEEDANRLLSLVDKDQSGKLDEREFCEFWATYRPMLPKPGIDCYGPGVGGAPGVQPGMGQPGQYGQPGMGQPGQYGQPGMGQPGQYGQPGMGQPGMGQPGMGGQPQYGQPGMGGQYGQPGMGAPGMM
jgi:Ca2+-binding EF-hand superfamily protein